MKKFWRILKKVLLVTSALSGAALFVVVLTSAVQKQHNLLCSKVQVKIDYDSGLAFLSEAEIVQKADYISGGKLTGTRLTSVDFRTMERELKKNPFIADAQVFVDQSQTVVVDVIQKRPIIRVINNDGVSYYLSEKNERIPLCNNFTPHVAVALGNVQTHKDAKRDSTVQSALYNLAKYIRTDEFLNALVDQVYVEEDGQLDVIPKTGGHTIKLGYGDNNLADEFNKLKVFYTDGLRKTGWDKYKTIDLRYTNQVVCEKKDTTNNL